MRVPLSWLSEFVDLELTPEELAELASYLISDASDWMRGEVVTLDGGEWLHGAGEFNDLLERPAFDWKALRRQAGNKG